MKQQAGNKNQYADQKITGSPGTDAGADENSTDRNRNNVATNRVTPDEETQATEQWLRRIPDDPGGLLRRKFLYQYQRQARIPDKDGKQW